MSIIRDITIQAEKQLMTDEILLFIGARQAGKTTILKQLQHKLESGGQNCHFLNLEDPEYLELLNQSPKNLFKVLDIDFDRKAFVFIDEVQYLANPTNFLKYLYDEYQGKIKLLVSGSSAFYIDRKFKDSMVGRKRIYSVGTLSFREFLRFKNEEALIKILPLDFSPDNNGFKNKTAIKAYERLTLYLDEFIAFGGYPRAVLAKNQEEKEMVLQDIGYSYVKKDLYESGVKHEDVFFKLIKILASQVGNLVNANELAGTLGVSKTAIDHYLYVLQKSHHISLIKPFFRNVRKELTKMPKIFFRDIGLRNFFINDFRKIIVRQDKGQLLENAVFRQMKDRFEEDSIRFWRTPQGNEIDFIINGQFAFEVKYSVQMINMRKYARFQKQYPEIPVNFVVYAKGKSETASKIWEAWEL